MDISDDEEYPLHTAKRVKRQESPHVYVGDLSKASIMHGQVSCMYHACE